MNGFGKRVHRQLIPRGCFAMSSMCWSRLEADSDEPWPENKNTAIYKPAVSEGTLEHLSKDVKGENKIIRDQVIRDGARGGK